MKNRNAFSVVEVLMALIICGVLMSLCVRVVVRETNSYERKVGYHKAVNVLNNAFAEYFNENSKNYKKTCNGKEIGLTDTCLDSSGNPIEPVITKSGSSYKEPSLIGQGSLNSDTDLMDNLFSKHLAIMSTGLPSGSKKIAGCDASSKYFYTADGMRYCFNYNKSTSGIGMFGDTTYGLIWVDVNGDEMPNKISTNKGDIGDTFPIVIMKNRFIPGHPSDTNITRISQEIYFAEDEKEGINSSGGSTATE